MEGQSGLSELARFKGRTLNSPTLEAIPAVYVIKMTQLELSVHVDPSLQVLMYMKL